MNAAKNNSTTTIVRRVLSMLLIIAAACFLIFQYQHTFTTQRWMGKPNERSAIVRNMLSRYELTGMTRDEVTSLLGASNSSNPNRMIYELGSAEGWLPIDLERLDIYFENDVVSDYAIVRYG